MEVDVDEEELIVAKEVASKLTAESDSSNDLSMNDQPRIPQLQ